MRAPRIVIFTDHFSKHWNFFAIDLKNEVSQPSHKPNHGFLGLERESQTGDLLSFHCFPITQQPFGNATWGQGDNATDWNEAAQKMGIHVLENHPEWKGLVFVEGINYSTDFRGFVDHPIDFGKSEWNERMVLSPHQYGPSVVQLDMFFNDSFPANMPDEWGSHWG